MIDMIQGGRSVETNLYAEKETNPLDQDAFLKIFMAQLSHQDPLNPMEGTEFTAQLAQFSSLEQLFNVNQHLESIEDVQDEGSRFQALNFMGKEIVAEGNGMSLVEGKNAKGAFSLNQRAECYVTIVDGAGNSVKSISLGVLEPGQHDFEWNGLNGLGASQPSGIYGFDVVAINENGSGVPANTMIAGIVSRVTLEGPEPVIYVGELPVSMSKVLDIRSADSVKSSEEDDLIEYAEDILG
jgi:flagellar basal-body rod modification protein FlgD